MLRVTASVIVLIAGWWGWQAWQEQRGVGGRDLRDVPFVLLSGARVGWSGNSMVLYDVSGEISLYPHRCDSCVAVTTGANWYVQTGDLELLQQGVARRGGDASWWTTPPMIGETAVGQVIDWAAVTGGIAASRGWVYVTHDTHRLLWHAKMRDYLRLSDDHDLSLRESDSALSTGDDLSGAGIVISTSPISQMIRTPSWKMLDLYRDEYTESLQLTTGDTMTTDTRYYSMANDPRQLSITDRVHTRTFDEQSQWCRYTGTADDTHATGSIQSFIPGSRYDVQLRCDNHTRFPAWGSSISWSSGYDSQMGIVGELVPHRHGRVLPMGSYLRMQ